LSNPDSGTGSLLAHAGVAVNRVTQGVNRQLDGFPRVEGAATNVQASRDLQAAFARTDKEAAKRGDDYIASELFLLALVDDKGETGRILNEAGLQRKPLEAAIDSVRGGEA